MLVINQISALAAIIAIAGAAPLPNIGKAAEHAVAHHEHKAAAVHTEHKAAPAHPATHSAEHAAHPGAEEEKKHHSFAHHVGSTAGTFATTYAQSSGGGMGGYKRSEELTEREAVLSFKGVAHVVKAVEHKGKEVHAKHGEKVKGAIKEHGPDAANMAAQSGAMLLAQKQQSKQMDAQGGNTATKRGLPGKVGAAFGHTHEKVKGHAKQHAPAVGKAAADMGKGLMDSVQQNSMMGGTGGYKLARSVDLEARDAFVEAHLDLAERDAILEREAALELDERDAYMELDERDASLDLDERDADPQFGFIAKLFEKGVKKGVEAGEKNAHKKHEHAASVAKHGAHAAANNPPPPPPQQNNHHRRDAPAYMQYLEYI